MNFQYTLSSRNRDASHQAAKQSNFFLAVKSFWAGIGSVLVICPSLDYKKPDKKGFSRDYHALMNDGHRVYSELSRETAKQMKHLR